MSSSDEVRDPSWPLAAAGFVLLVVTLAGTILFAERLAPLFDAATLEALLRRAGPAAPLVFVLLQVTQVLVAPIPSPAVALLGGYLFGPVVGSLLSIAGVAIGSALAFWLARRFGRGVVERFVPAGAVARFDAITAERGLAGLFLAFLIPGLPDDALCFVGGLTAIPLRRLVAVAVLGRAPTIVALSLLGAGIAERNVALVVVLGGVLVALSLAGYLLRHRLFGAPSAASTSVPAAGVDDARDSNGEQVEEPSSGVEPDRATAQPGAADGADAPAEE